MTFFDDYHNNKSKTFFHHGQKKEVWHLTGEILVALGVTVSPNMDVFLEKVQTALTPPSPRPFLEIMLRFFRKYTLTCINLQ